jgi:predicted ABC-type transport system involved in lysophospholipase L1 biosynthesis ATPase subunit
MDLREQSVSTAIRVTKLGKRVRLPESELCILEDVSFSLNRGETAAIVGSAGRYSGFGCDDPR